MDSKQIKDKGKPETSDSSKAKKQADLLLKPLTPNNILYYYSPIIGTASYSLLSINVLNPGLRFGFFPKKDLTNILLLNTLAGAGCYIYSRQHIKSADKNSRIGFSVMGSVMFSFSSVLFWAILRSVLPENVVVCSAAGLASSYVLLQGAKKYLDYVDSKVTN